MEHFAFHSASNAWDRRRSTAVTASAHVQGRMLQVETAEGSERPLTSKEPWESFDPVSHSPTTSISRLAVPAK